MSILTQRKCLEGVRPGSVAYVVGHARWRKSRGKRPSLSFKGELNPEVALRVAIEEFDKLIDLANYWLSNARGDDPASHHLMWFRSNASKAGVSLSYFKTGEEELEKINLKCYENTAKFWLNRAKGDDPALYHLKYFKDSFSKSGLSLNHFQTDEAELKKLEETLRK